jgi:hypothetical protein
MPAGHIVEWANAKFQTNYKPNTTAWLLRRAHVPSEPTDEELNAEDAIKWLMTGALQYIKVDGMHPQVGGYAELPMIRHHGRNVLLVKLKDPHAGKVKSMLHILATCFHDSSLPCSHVRGNAT